MSKEKAKPSLKSVSFCAKVFPESGAYIPEILPSD